MIVFEKPGIENTENTLRIALETAAARNLPILLSSNTGETAEKLLLMQEDTGLRAKIVMVGQVCGFAKPGTAALPPEKRRELENKGIVTVLSAHALSGAERSISRKFGGVYPAELAASTLRMLGQGIKVCVEIGMMAMDCGALEYGKPVVAIAGTGRGSDTACILTPSYTASFLDSKIHEILCKPSLYE